MGNRDQLRSELTFDSLLKAEASIGQIGCCSDNTTMEKLCHYLESKTDPSAELEDCGKAPWDRFGCIEGYCNRQHLHSALGYFTTELAKRNASYSGSPAIDGRSSFQQKRIVQASKPHGCSLPRVF